VCVCVCVCVWEEHTNTWRLRTAASTCVSCLCRLTAHSASLSVRVIPWSAYSSAESHSVLLLAPEVSGRGTHNNSTQLPEREHLQHTKGQLGREVESLVAAENKQDASSGWERRPRQDGWQLDVQPQPPAHTQPLRTGALALQSPDFLLQGRGNAVVADAVATSRH